MFRKMVLNPKWILLMSILVLVCIFATFGSSVGSDGQPFPPGSRVEGYHPDALLILHNLGAGASLRVNSEGSGPGLRADSKNGDGIAARTLHKDKSGVFGHSTIGVGVTGRSDNNYGVVGVTAHKDSSGVLGRSTVGVGVIGRSVNNDGVFGTTESKNKSGVFGHSAKGFGVTGTSDDYIGVQGYSPNGTGVFARSDKGTALYVDGTSIFKNFASFEGGHGDLAENYYGSGHLEGGDVVVIDPTSGMTVKLAINANDTSVAGIVSTAPAMKLTGQIDDNQGIPLVIAGRTPCKVDATYGAITPGDLLTTSPTPGYAMKAQPIMVDEVEFYRPGTIIGKALETWDEEKGIIMVLVSMH